MILTNPFDVFWYILRYWWVWLGPVSFSLFVSAWVHFRQTLYKQGIAWTLLEIKMPLEVDKSPKAMDQFFSAVYGLRNFAGNLVEKYWDGEVTLWFSLEAVSFSGEIHFYIRTPTKHKNVVMSHLYANYPTLDIEEATDYMENFPKNLRELHDKELEIWGTELVLGKADTYPIRTYMQFEDILGDERNLDPIASLLEVFGKLRPKENVLLQILIRPADPDWRTKGEALIKKLKGREKGEEEFTTRTPGETELLKACEQKLSKSGFDCLIRYIYIADRTIFDVNFAKRGTLSSFNQYGAPHLNFFRHNFSIYTQVNWITFPFFFPGRRLEVRRERILQNFRERQLPEETAFGRLAHAQFLHFNLTQRVCKLNTEELATLYHPPTKVVLTAPLIKRVESKKLGPPAGLLIYEDETP